MSRLELLTLIPPPLLAVLPDNVEWVKSMLEYSVKIPPPKYAAVLSETVVFVKDTFDPNAAIPPPLLFTAEFPENSLSVMVATVLLNHNPPPLPVAELPAMTLLPRFKLHTFAAPDPQYKNIAPPDDELAPVKIK